MQFQILAMLLHYFMSEKMYFNRMRNNYQMYREFHCQKLSISKLTLLQVLQLGSCQHFLSRMKIIKKICKSIQLQVLQLSSLHLDFQHVQNQRLISRLQHWKALIPLLQRQYMTRTPICSLQLLKRNTKEF